MSTKILVVDDDPNIRQVISFALKKSGRTPYEATNGKEALQVFNKLNPDLIILDINMPELDGLEVCKEIRKTSNTPILFLSSRDEEIDRIIGLEIGGDDYVTKPFSPRELTARVGVILKRTSDIKFSQEITKLEHGPLTLEIDKHTCLWQGHPIALTATEFSILRIFLQYPQKVFDRDSIMTGAYNININVSDRTIDSHIRHIRNKFQDLGCNNVVETVRGVGYRLGLVG